MTTIRLSKALSRTGIASRRKAEDIIFSKRVKVNGQITSLPQTLVDPQKDCIEIDNQKISTEEKKVYFLLNKPKGYICSNTRYKNQKIVIDLFQDYPCRLFTIGRLDKDTTGLLLLTNDGIFAQKLIHPSSNITKEYLFKVKENITPLHLLLLKKGCFIEGQKISPVKVKKVRKGTCKITVKEGKKHEIRILIKNAQLTLIELKRIRLGSFTLGSLKEGFSRPLSDREKQVIFSLLL